MSHAGPITLGMTVCLMALAPSAFGQDAPAAAADVQGLPLEAWGRELRLAPEQAAALERLNTWFVDERRALAAHEGTLNRRELLQRRDRLLKELERRLGEILTPDQVVQLDLEELLLLPIPRLLATVRASGQGTFQAAFDEGPGDLTTVGTTANLQVRLSLSRPLALSLGVGGGVTSFDFDDADVLDPVDGDPFDTLLSTRASVGLTWQISRNWSAFGTVTVSTGVEEGVALEDGVVFGGFVGVSYAFTRNFSLGLGLSVNTQLEDDARIIPLPIVRLRVDLTETLRFTLGVPDGLRLTYAPFPELEVSITGGLGNALGTQDARLDDEGFAPNGVFRQSAYPVGVVLDWRPVELLRVSVEAGALVYRKLELDDERGRSLTDVRTDPTGYLSLSLTFTF